MAQTRFNLEEGPYPHFQTETPSSPPRALLFWVGLTLAILVSRLANINVLWTDEDYHLAAAIQLLHGKALYRDLWYDKPPLNAWLFLLFGAWPGWPMRVFGTLLAVLSCVFAYRFGAGIWSRREGYAAAALMGFFQVFYFQASTIPMEPDTLMLAPHLATIYLAWRGRYLGSGVAAGIAFLMNPKAAFVVISALAFLPLGSVRALAVAALSFGGAFVVVNGIALAFLVSQGAAQDFFLQVWKWGLMYAGSPPVDMGAFSPLQKLGHWLGFHALLVIGAARLWLARTESGALRLQFAFWTLISLAAAAVGFRFAPHYLNQLLPPLVICAARGWTLLIPSKGAEPLSPMHISHPESSPADASPPRPAGWAKWVAIAALAAGVVVPVVRFSPHYAELIADDLQGRRHTWEDVHMDQDARRAADIINAAAQPDDTIFIWGYRPNIIDYTRLPAVGKFWESQPVTGVPADRHLSSSQSLDADLAKRNLQELVRSRPNIIVDGLSLYNQDLSMQSRVETRNWLLSYCEIGNTGQGILIYQRCR